MMMHAMKMRGDAGGPDMMQHRGPGDRPMMMKRGGEAGREMKCGGGHGDDACPMMKRGGHEGGSDMMRHRGPGDRPMMMKHGGSDKPGCQMKCESKPGGPDQHRWKRHRR